jgi:SAM-dependent methyltransferase
LKLADIGCGSGDFSKMARHFGHNCLATETAFNLCENELATYFDHLSFTRYQRRRLYNLNEHTLSVRPQELTHLNSYALDVIYLSQCVFHFPELNKTKKSWIEKDWYFLLTDLANYLQPEGLIFMSLVDPCYKTLPPLLAHFYIDYSVVFPDWGAAWWPLLIIQKQNLLRYLQDPKQNSKAGEDLGWENINRAQFMKDTKNKISDLIKIN